MVEIHQVSCPECGEAYFTKFPDELPHTKEEGCVSCEADIRLNYSESDEGDVHAEIEAEVIDEGKLNSEEENSPETETG